jgi:hypothetical protein
MNERLFLLLASGQNFDARTVTNAFPGVTIKSVSTGVYLIRCGTAQISAHELFGKITGAGTQGRDVAIIPVDPAAVKDAYLPQQWAEFFSTTRAA